MKSGMNQSCSVACETGVTLKESAEPALIAKSVVDAGVELMPIPAIIWVMTRYASLVIPDMNFGSSAYIALV